MGCPRWCASAPLLIAAFSVLAGGACSAVELPGPQGIRIELRRSGVWPADAGWCSFQTYLPISHYGQAEYRADGRMARYPAALTGDGNIESGIRRLECHLGDPALNLVFECPTGMALSLIHI